MAEQHDVVANHGLDLHGLWSCILNGYDAYMIQKICLAARDHLFVHEPYYIKKVSLIYFSWEGNMCCLNSYVKIDLMGLNNISSMKLQGELWNISLSLHKYNRQERIKYLDFLFQNKDEYSDKTLFWCIVNMLHVYFSLMDDEEKGKYIELILNIFSDIDKKFLGDIFELIAKLIRVSPISKKKDLIDYIYNNFDEYSNNAYATIGFCNASILSICELNQKMKERFISKLESIESKKEFDYIEDTIKYTLNKLKSGE